jgi:hypothetical protein
MQSALAVAAVAVHQQLMQAVAVQVDFLLVGLLHQQLAQ